MHPPQLQIITYLSNSKLPGSMHDACASLLCESNVVLQEHDS